MSHGRYILASILPLVSKNTYNQFHRYRTARKSHCEDTIEELLIAEMKSQLNSGSLEYSDRCCPECNAPFALLTLAGIEVDCCRMCGGTWFDSGELKDLTDTHSDIPSENLRPRSSKYKCPVCNKQMLEHVYQKPHFLLVDRCAKHGIYLEDKELKWALQIT